MKTRALLLALLVVAQLLWLAWRNYCAQTELANAPRIVLPAQRERHIVNPILDFHLRDAEIFGDSLWWGERLSDRPYRYTIKDARKVSSPIDRERSSDRPYRYATPDDDEKGLAPRPCPEGMEDTAQELVHPDAAQQTLAVFWRRGEDGSWIPRLEAAGSPQDVPREGEVRCEGSVGFLDLIKKDGVLVDVVVRLTSCTLDMQHEATPNAHKKLRAYLSSHSLDAINKLRADNRKVDISYSMEIALRKNAPPIITQVFLNDVPEHEAADMILQGNIPQPHDTTTPAK